MKNKIKRFLLPGTLGVLCLLLSSCGKEEVLFVEHSSAWAEDFSENGERKEDCVSGQSGNLALSGDNSQSGQSDLSGQNGQSVNPELSGKNDMSGLSPASIGSELSEVPPLILVHVCGAVQTPGVYELAEGSRAADAVTAAGGFAKEADEEYVNLATRLEDGSKIKIPTKDETEQMSQDETSGNDSCIIVPQTPENARNASIQKVNINTADKETLCTLPGIGETRAESIIAYRSSQGAFFKIEDIMLVNGIKESSFQKIKEYITTE